MQSETEAFAAGKARAVAKLDRYAKPGSVEAAICLLCRDGAEYDFQEGQANSVAINFPRGEDVAIFHAHPDHLAHGSDDFLSVLKNSEWRESYVACSDKIY